LVGLHTVNVFLERNSLFARHARLEAKKFGQFLAVAFVLVDSELEVLRECIVKLLVGFL
jgi:hypothetical protein